MTDSVSHQTASATPTTGKASAAQRRLALVAGDPGAGPADLAVAWRGSLRAQSEEAGYTVAAFNERIDSISGYLPAVGLVKGPEGYEARPWKPAWLADVPSSGVDECWYPRMRRSPESVSGDPMLSLLGHSQYSSEAQRESLQSVCCAADGETVLVCLPTGAGKSHCAFLPALLPLDDRESRLGVSLIIVPTVALALDLEGRMKQRVGHAIAYRPENPEEAEGIRQRCAEGVQGPVIASPEALTGALKTALRSAAQGGWLRHFVIDEAHIVLSWGDEFRPAFLALAAVRRDLAQRTPNRTGFVTVLLSATFTDYHLRWLKHLLSDGDRFKIVHAARLRPEPAYWLARAPTAAQRDAWIEEAVHNLPRPCIIYTTQRAECARWADRLRQLGFHRVGVMTGQSDEAERRRVLRDWCNDAIDIVVATSAFGLGIDKADVRSIIHAELPESVDRFYQDVGRAGRDGCSAVSLLVSCVEDRRAALGISRPKFITGRLGLERWQRLHKTRQPAPDTADAVLINLQVGRDMDMRGDKNRNWNLRTLQLLARSGAIEFAGSNAETTEMVAIRLRPVQSLSDAYWDREVGAVRAELISDYYRNGRLLLRLDNGKAGACLSQLFAECYASDTFHLSVVTACGGCPFCRRTKQKPFAGRMVARRAPATPAVARPVGVDLARWLGGQPAGLILLPQTDPPHLVDLFAWCATQGVTTFVLPREAGARLDQAAQRSPGQLFFRAPRLPRAGDVLAEQLVCLWLTESTPPGWQERYDRLKAGDPPILVLATANTRAPGDRVRFLKDVFPGPVMAINAWANQFVA